MLNKKLFNLLYIGVLSLLITSCFKKYNNYKNEEDKVGKIENKKGNVSVNAHIDSEVSYDDLQILNYIYKFKETDKIASVGAGNGLNEVKYSYLKPHLTFHLEDIDPKVLNAKSLEKIKRAVEKEYSAPINDSFFIFIGDSLHTNLMDNYYDKILIERTLHEMKYPSLMLKDINGKLKHNGNLFISETCSPESYTKIVCGYFAWTKDELISLVSKQGFELLKVHEPIYSPYYYTFEFKKIN